ncbi:hypothetical protein A2851_03090 [Candidatus Kaiserbacteria bacterium RIFCSPHIGHO2_01_FULL_53_29]|uniref:Prephenate/arogenate dehydrogenase domain-containing protein n=1 Tax=Candidatus Kaiserbacteria bacterium RIFCSPHIGHO2_01_FULL_53_29 TaxID=1798480 RepID=A0A1F6CV83_9BACT|nr:MAG: hypothetical protein A2851_03090 [Candidatus Kaiserbacteria bacterium RIFCSPHIGHO2_01_FULL_53_29]
MELKTVGIIGYGAFGALAHTLIKRFAPSVTVRVHSEHHPSDGKQFFSLEETAQSDAVVFAVPIHAYEEALREIVPLMRQDSVIVDVATVKVHTVQMLKQYARGRRYIATHPVWGPESYEKCAGDIRGFRIVMTDGTLSIEEYNALTAFLRGLGFDVVEMSAESHDKYIAETLFLTHFIAQIFARAGIKRTKVDTVSFASLMNAIEGVQHDQELFKDVYKYNPYCKEVLKRFGIGESEVQKLLL